LQLQEEEEERHHAELARRRRETELSQQYIEQQGREPNNNVPVSSRGAGRTRGNPAANRGAPANTRGRGSSSNINVNAPQEARPAIPPRRSNAGTHVIADPEAGVADAPPSYEQAANQAAYVPPSNHPAHPSTPLGGPGGGGRRMSAYSANAANAGYQSPVGRVATGGRRGTLIEQIPGPGPGVGRRNTGGSDQQRERDCVVM
jgi:hypothetical protein